MTTKIKLLLGLVTIFVVPTSGVSGQQSSPNTLGVQITVAEPKGMCKVTVKAGTLLKDKKPMSLEFAYVIGDGRLRVATVVNGWKKAQEADPNYDFPVKLTFDTGETTTSQSGGYSTGFNDMQWGIWSGDEAKVALRMLRGAGSVLVQADGLGFGDIDIGNTGMVYKLITNCVTKQNSGG